MEEKAKMSKEYTGEELDKIAVGFLSNKIERLQIEIEESESKRKELEHILKEGDL